MFAISLYAAALFYVLEPGVLVTLPPGGSRFMVNLTHALVFGVVWAFTHRAVLRMLN
jgi:hypothetical protein